jgi:hypothetical protein
MLEMLCSTLCGYQPFLPPNDYIADNSSVSLFRDLKPLVHHQHRFSAQHFTQASHASRQRYLFLIQYGPSVGTLLPLRQASISTVSIWERMTADPQRLQAECTCDVARAHEEARRVETAKQLRRLVEQLHQAPNNPELQEQLQVTYCNELVSRIRYNQMVPIAWQMTEDYEQHEKDAVGLTEGLQLDVEQHTFDMYMKWQSAREKEQDMVVADLLRSPSHEGSQPDDITTTSSVCSDHDGQSQGHSQGSQVTVGTATCCTSSQPNGTGTERPGSSQVETEQGTSDPPSLKD